MRRALLVSCFILFVGMSPAIAQTPLAWRLNEKDRFYIAMTYKRHMQTKLGDQTVLMDNDCQSVTRVTVLERLPGGGLVLETVMESYHCGDIRPDPLTMVLRGGAFRCTLDANMNIVRVDDLDPVIKDRISQMPENMRPLAREMAEDFVRGLLEPTLIPLPKKPAAKGDQWKQPFKLVIEGMGHMAIDKTFTYEGTEMLDGNAVHKIGMHAAMTILKDAGTAVQPVSYAKSEMVEQDSTDAYRFDAAAGRLLGSHRDSHTKIKFTMFNLGRYMDCEADARNIHDVRLFDHNPLRNEAEAARHAPPPIAIKAEKPWTNSLGMQLVRIQPGKFRMGSDEEDPDHRPDETQHEVEITKAFHFAVHEVTVSQFRKFVEDAKYQTDGERYTVPGFGFDKATGKFLPDKRFNWRDPGFEQTDDHPVVNVSWKDAVAFCEWLSKKEGKTYRLPTEAEWEYACRAGTQTRYYNGDESETLGAVANILDESGKTVFATPFTKYAANDGYVFTAPVGKYKPNAFGLFDMHGNANEWCSDFYAPYDKGEKKDPNGPPQGTFRVGRGGSFIDYAYSCRSANRMWFPENHSNCCLGFRVALTEEK